MCVCIYMHTHTHSAQLRLVAWITGHWKIGRCHRFPSFDVNVDITVMGDSAVVFQSEPLRLDSKVIVFRPPVARITKRIM